MVWQIISTVIGGIGLIGVVICSVIAFLKYRGANDGGASVPEILMWFVLACIAACFAIGFGIAALVAWL